MPNRRLTDEELSTLFAPLIADVRSRLRTLAAEDEPLHWALRRKIAKELVYDERSKPAIRRGIKTKKRAEQGGECALCTANLPRRGAVLDRFEAMKGYTRENTRLICQRVTHKSKPIGTLLDARCSKKRNEFAQHRTRRRKTAGWERRNQRIHA